MPFISILFLLFPFNIGHAIKNSLSISDLLKDKIICIDPGHGGTAGKDLFRQGPTGEREEWMNLRVALILTQMLEQAGATVILTRSEDIELGLRERADMAINAGAHLFISIHHNGTTLDPEVNFPLIFYFKDASRNPASVDFAKILVRNFEKYMGLPRGEIYSDWTIFPNSGTAVLRHTYSYMPGVIGEASFFTNPEEEKRLKDPEYNRIEAQAYFDAIIEYFRNGLPTVELIRPKPGEPLTELNPKIRFQLKDGLNDRLILPESIRVYWNGTEIKHSFDVKNLIGSIQPTEFIKGNQSIQIFAQNINQQSVHPRIFTIAIDGKLKGKIEKQLIEPVLPVIPIRLIEPAGRESINPDVPLIRLQIDDMELLKEIDFDSIEIYFNHRKIDYQYDPQTGIIQLKPKLEFPPVNQLLVIYNLKDKNGQNLLATPMKFSIRIPYTPDEPHPKEWLISYEQGAEIINEIAKYAKLNQLNMEQKDKLLKGIGYLSRSLELFPNSQISGRAQYLIGLGFEIYSNESYYIEQSINAYTRTIEYYPTFDTVPLAKSALNRLKSK